MHSELFSLGPFTVHSFGVCMATGFLLGWWVVSYLCRKTGQNADSISSLLTWLMVSAIIGARAAYVIEHWNAEFAGHPAQIFRIDQGGLMFYGGLIAAAAGLALFAKISRRHWFEITDLVLTAVPLGHAFGRIGCFFHGCCYGRIVKNGWGVCFPKYSPAWHEQLNATPPLIDQFAAQSLPVIPTQLIEAGCNFLLFLFLFANYTKRHHLRGFQSGCYLMGYAVIRFCIEYLRGDPRFAVGPFSISQTISFAVFLAGAVILYLSLHEKKLA